MITIKKKRKKKKKSIKTEHPECNRATGGIVEEAQQIAKSMSVDIERLKSDILQVHGEYKYELELVFFFFFFSFPFFFSFFSFF